MKTFLWATTLLGLAPMVALSVLQLSHLVAMRRALPQEIDNSDDGTFTVTTTTIQLGSTSRPVSITPRAWPAILSLAGSTLCLAGLFFLIPRQPIHVDTNGYDKFEPLLLRLMSSSAAHPSLIVSARESDEALLVMRNGIEWELHLSANSQNHETIKNIKQHFSERGIDAVQNYTTYDKAFDIETTHLVFPLSGNSTADAQTCVIVFRDIIGVTASEPMEFKIEP